MEIVKIINKTENNINIGEVVLYVGENIIFNINDKESYDTGFSLLLYFDTIITKAIDENEIETFVDGNKVETRESYLLLWNNLKLRQSRQSISIHRLIKSFLRRFQY